MPTYVYKFVDTGETIEVQQGFHEDNLTALAHPDTGEVLPVKKVFTPVGVTFKGSGFFKTDSRGTKGSGASTSSSDTAAASGSSTGASSESGGSSSATASSADSGSKPAASSTPAAG